MSLVSPGATSTPTLLRARSRCTDGRLKLNLWRLVVYSPATVFKARLHAFAPPPLGGSCASRSVTSFLFLLRFRSATIAAAVECSSTMLPLICELFMLRSSLLLISLFILSGPLWAPSFWVAAIFPFDRRLVWSEWENCQLTVRVVGSLFQRKCSALWFSGEILRAEELWLLMFSILKVFTHQETIIVRRIICLPIKTSWCQCNLLQWHRAAQSLFWFVLGLFLWKLNGWTGFSPKLQRAKLHISTEHWRLHVLKYLEAEFYPSFHQPSFFFTFSRGANVS